MPRIIVLGGFGFFGSLAAQCLRAAGLTPLVGARRAGVDVLVDVEDRASLREALRPGDVLLDAAGPYRRRSTALIEAAINIGCDVVDLADSLDYVRGVYALEDRIAAAGIRVFTACSSVSAISAAMIRRSGIERPVRVTGFLVPATRHTAVRGTAASLFCSVGRPIEIFRDGRLTTVLGWGRSYAMSLPAPLGPRTGYLFETADALTLPACWPSLRQVECYVDTNVLGLNGLFHLAARWPALRRVIDRYQSRALFLARWLGSIRSGLAYEIEGADGKVARIALTSAGSGQVIPIAPAILAVQRLAANRVSDRGLIPPNREVDAEELCHYLEARGVQLHAGLDVRGRALNAH
jgi:hypothetical protein